MSVSDFHQKSIEAAQPLGDCDPAAKQTPRLKKVVIDQNLLAGDAALVELVSRPNFPVITKKQRISADFPRLALALFVDFPSAPLTADFPCAFIKTGNSGSENSEIFFDNSMLTRPGIRI